MTVTGLSAGSAPAGQDGAAKMPDLTAEEKAAILADVLPWIQRWQGKVVVIKHGGSTMEEGAAAGGVLRDIVMLRAMGVRPVVVHGGGKTITAWLERLGLPARFVDGLRVTDAETMTVVEMVLAGQVNKALVAGLNRLDGGCAIGLSGFDGALLTARQRRSPAGDLGHVGEIVGVRSELLERLLAEGFIPVIAPVAADERGVHYNVNADDAAAAVAGALRAEKLVFLTDVPGVMVDADRDGTPEPVSRIDAATAHQFIARGEIRGGMVPKVEAGLRALAAGVGSVHIIDGRRPHALLVELFTSEGVGTMVVGGERGRVA